MHVQRYHFHSQSRVGGGTEKYTVVAPVRMKGVVAARLISADFASKSSSFIDITQDTTGRMNTLRMSLCLLTSNHPSYDESKNVKTVDVTFPVGSYTFTEFKQFIETTVNSAFVDFGGNVGDNVFTQVTLNAENHLQFQFTTSSLSSNFLGIRFKVHAGLIFYTSEVDFENSLPFRLGFQYDDNDVVLSYNMDSPTMVYEPLNTVLGSVNNIQIVEGENDELRFAIGFESGTLGLLPSKTFLINLKLPPGTYDTSIILKEMERQLNSKRVYVDANGDRNLSYTEYISGGMDGTGLLYGYTFGKVVFKVYLDETSGKTIIDFFDDISYIYDTIHTKVFTGTDMYPTQADFDKSLPALLGFDYKPLENDTTAYDKTTYQNTYNPIARYGKHESENAAQITVSTFTPNLQNLTDIEIIDGKNSFSMGIGFVYNGNYIGLNANNVWISNIYVIPGKYTYDQLITAVQDQMNSLRRYSSSINPNNYISGGYNFNFSLIGYSDFGSITTAITLDDENKLNFQFTNNIKDFPLGDITELYVKFYTGVDEYPTASDYSGSLPDLLGIPYEPSYSSAVSRFDPSLYLNGMQFNKLTYDLTVPVPYSFDTTPLEITIGVASEDLSEVNTYTVRRDLTKKQYTFGEIKIIIENMISSSMKYTNALKNVIVPSTSGLNNIDENVQNQLFPALSFNDTTKKATLSLDAYLLGSLFPEVEESNKQGKIMFSINSSLDLYKTTEEYELSIPYALGLDLTQENSLKVYNYIPTIESYIGYSKKLYDLENMGKGIYLSINEMDQSKISGDVENRENQNTCFARMSIPDNLLYEPQHPEIVWFDDSKVIDKLSIEWFQLSSANEKIPGLMVSREHSFSIDFFSQTDETIANNDQKQIRTFFSRDCSRLQ